MVDFHIPPSSERTVSFMAPFRRSVAFTILLYRTIPQSLRDSSLYTREPFRLSARFYSTIRSIRIPIYLNHREAAPYLISYIFFQIL